MTIEATIEALDEIDDFDPEVSHQQADAIIIEFLPKEVQEAYRRVIDRQHWWAFA